MNLLLTQLEAMKSEGKKEVSIDFLLIELRDIHPTHHENDRDVPYIPYRIKDMQIIVDSKLEPYRGE